MLKRGCAGTHGHAGGRFSAWLGRWAPPMGRRFFHEAGPGAPQFYGASVKITRLWGATYNYAGCVQPHGKAGAPMPWPRDDVLHGPTVGRDGGAGTDDLEARDTPGKIRRGDCWERRSDDVTRRSPWSRLHRTSRRGGAEQDRECEANVWGRRRRGVGTAAPLERIRLGGFGWAGAGSYTGKGTPQALDLPLREGPGDAKNRHEPLRCSLPRREIKPGTFQK